LADPAPQNLKALPPVSISKNHRFDLTPRSKPIQAISSLFKAFQANSSQKNVAAM
jgi:hypothetical protein